jgi:GTP diphosphokinase / guanosine-3',5'-bis(diphosphate) 3'-diphosphatase
MTHEATFEYLLYRLKSNLSEGELNQVSLAFEIADEAHRGQTRDEGTPYIVHPLRVAISLVDELDIHSPRLVCAALMHDVIEDSSTTREDIAGLFGEPIAEIVWLLTKLEEVSLVEYLRRIEAESETGAPVVKLCDRLDNLRSVVYTHKLEKKRRYVRTTEDLYLPMASRTNHYLYDELLKTLEDVRKELAGSPETM